MLKRLLAVAAVVTASIAIIPGASAATPKLHLTAVTRVEHPGERVELTGTGFRVRDTVGWIGAGITHHAKGQVLARHIYVTVPRVSSGLYAVAVFDGRTVSNRLMVTITATPKPTVACGPKYGNYPPICLTSITPDSAKDLAKVVLTATGLEPGGLNQGATVSGLGTPEDVNLNPGGKSVTAMVDINSELKPGLLSVSIQVGNLTSNSLPFHYLGSVGSCTSVCITSITPDRAQTGATIVIRGSGFYVQGQANYGVSICFDMITAQDTAAINCNNVSAPSSGTILTTQANCASGAIGAGSVIVTPQTPSYVPSSNKYPFTCLAGA